MINVVDDQRGDHKHTYIHVLSYGIIPAGWFLSPFATKTGSRATAVSYLLLSRH